jgi:hypothetical protein
VVDDRKQALKKFLHDYVVAIITTFLLLVILGLLIIARHYALVSVNDLSKINPLITSEQNELVAANGSHDVIKIAKDDESRANQSSPANNAGRGANQSINPSKGSSGETTTGASDGTGVGSGQSSSPTTPQPFSASIGQMTYNSSTSCVLIICSTTYTVQAVIQGQNGPGTVNYQWIEDNSTVAQSSSVAFSQNDTSKTVSFQWTIAKGHTVTLQLTSPSTDKKSVSLQ